MTKTVNVTQKNIDDSLKVAKRKDKEAESYDWCASCPVANAISDLGFPIVHVGKAFVRLDNNWGSMSNKVTLPSEVGIWIERFDEKLRGEPFLL